jgi:hypothetical protein
MNNAMDLVGSGSAKSKGQFTFSIVAEDSLAFENATTVGDLVGFELAQEHWSDGDAFFVSRQWTGHPMNPAESYVKLSTLNKLQVQIWGETRRFHGRYDGEDIRVKKAVAIFDELDPPIDVLVISLDIDRDEPRLDRLKEGIVKSATSCAVVLAAMNPEAEGWRICTFVPQDVAEEQLLLSVRKELSFNPVAEPERLDSRSRGVGLRNVKTCHDTLMPSTERSLQSLKRTVSELNTVSGYCGLPDFVADFREALVEIEPTFIH